MGGAPPGGLWGGGAGRLGRGRSHRLWSYHIRTRHDLWHHWVCGGIKKLVALTKKWVGGEVTCGICACEHYKHERHTLSLPLSPLKLCNEVLSESCAVNHEGSS